MFDAETTRNVAFILDPYAFEDGGEPSEELLRSAHSVADAVLHATDPFIGELRKIAAHYPPGTALSVDHDGFAGAVIGYYVTREGKPGLVLQGEGTRVVHVYQTRWFKPPAAPVLGGENE